ncbi:alpha-E domain-containing protein [Amaricoccus tamworthensis]|uniref:alpha-E domain-containing protein n=1 Tax=Amaricoccus tamworthensis TaxID=57002 RepID=UPI003C7E6E57
MLSRTAENLFWIGRYMERSETMARLLEVGYRMSLMPSTGAGNRNEWESLVVAAGSSAGFRDKYGSGEVKQRDVESWMFFDRDNGSSIISCLENARQNGRAVRTALTTSMWDALNSAYLELRELERTPRSELALPELCDWTKRQSALFRGETEGTHLQNDGYDFYNLGAYIERGDNTARILDVKYYILLPTTDTVGGGVDTYQWSTLLRSLSVFRSFHWSYGSEYSPRKITDFLIFNRACPRSLLFSANRVGLHLDRLSAAYGSESPACRNLQKMLTELSTTTLDHVIEEGLHEFLTRFINDNATLGQSVADSYLFGVQ